MSDLPERIVVDQHGHYWRDFGDYWSMCPVSEENVDTEVVATYIRAEAASPAALDVDEVLDLLVTCRGILAPKGYSGVTQRIDRLAARLTGATVTSTPEGKA